MANNLSEIPEGRLHLEQVRASYYKRRKIYGIITISLLFLVIVFLGLYHLTDIVFGPPDGLNAISKVGEWAMFHHDPGRTGSVSPSGVLPRGKLSWVFPTGGAIHSSPAVANGTVYVGSWDGKLYALDAATGDKLWEFQTGSSIESSPAVQNGVVYFGSNDGSLYALDAATGEKLWAFNTKYAIKSTPTLADGIVYFGSDDYCVYALDAGKGTEVWHFQTGNYVKSSPAVTRGIVHVGSMDGFYYALNARNGRLRLKFSASTAVVVSSPAVVDNISYFSNARGLLYGVDVKARNWPLEIRLRPYWSALYMRGGAPRPAPPSGYLWSLSMDSPKSSSPAVLDENLYIGSGSKLFSIDTGSQEERWVFETGDTISSSPAVADTGVYVGSEDGCLYALDTITGEKLWDYRTGGKITSSPAVADGTVYIGSHDGNLYAIK
jgi:outer membrane protein assembly factor BamB